MKSLRVGHLAGSLGRANPGTQGSRRKGTGHRVLSPQGPSENETLPSLSFPPVEMCLSKPLDKEGPSGPSQPPGRHRPAPGQRAGPWPTEAHFYQPGCWHPSAMLELRANQKNKNNRL